MNRYFKILNHIEVYNNRTNKSNTLLNKIKAYVKGDITSKELIEETNISNRIYIYLVINNLLNDSGNDIKYYIGVPISDLLSRGGDPYLYAAEVDETEMIYLYSVGDEYIRVRGPLDEYDILSAKIGMSKKIDINHLNPEMIEVVGNLSNYPNGALLSTTDWRIIVKTDPYFYERMYTKIVSEPDYKSKNKCLEMEQVKKIIDKNAAKYSKDIYSYDLLSMKNNPPDDESLPKEKIDKNRRRYISSKEAAKLKIRTHIDYLTLEEALSGEFGSFLQLIERSKKEELPTTAIDEEKYKQIKEYLENHHDLEIDYNSKADGKNIDIMELIQYLQSDLHKLMSKSIYGNIHTGFHIYNPNYWEYLSPKSCLGTGKKRNILMLADLLINYINHNNIYNKEDPSQRAEDINNELSWFWKDPEVINAKICGIPLLEFAKLNSPEMAEQFIKYGAKNEKVETIQEDDVLEVANLLLRSTSKKIAIENNYPILEPFKEGYTNHMKI